MLCHSFWQESCKSDNKEREGLKIIDSVTKLNKIYDDCLSELNAIGLDFNDGSIGKIDISISKRRNKRYGCCKNEEPDKKTAYRKGRRIYYSKFNVHHIEVSPWVIDLQEDIIKNTIIHELIHCLPDCNNHGKQFKYYASYVNEKLGYNISRVGNKKDDFEKSGLDYVEEQEEKFKYKVCCKNCGYTFYRKRMQRGFTRKYRCGKCAGRFEVVQY